jgi:hypothetical protein
MKRKLLILLLGFACTFGSCVVQHSHNRNSGKRVPPGQAKKMHGSKSAKPFAPGQQKK